MTNFKTALITGASSGIGKEFAIQLARKGVDLILISRDYEKLLKLKNQLDSEYNIRIFIYKCDLLAEDFIENIGKFLDDIMIIPDLLINNAGSGKYGEFLENDFEYDVHTMELNIFTVMALCKLLVPFMISSGGGTILNVSSTLAFRPSPKWGVYSAAKAFIFSYSRTLSIELKEQGINVSVLCPGKTDTKFDINANAPINIYSRKSSPESVVNYTLKKIEKGKILIIPGIRNKLKYYLFKLLPDLLTIKILIMLNKNTN